jgi:hypothetical protein
MGRSGFAFRLKARGDRSEEVGALLRVQIVLRQITFDRAARPSRATRYALSTIPLGTSGYDYFTSMLFSVFSASDDFGSTTVSTPFLKLASILSASTPSGTPKER